MYIYVYIYIYIYTVYVHIWQMLGTNDRLLTFRGPCIVIYSYNKSQRDAPFFQIYLIKHSTCFGHVHCPSSGVSQHCIHAISVCYASSVGSLLAWSGPR